MCAFSAVSLFVIQWTEIYQRLSALRNFLGKKTGAGLPFPSQNLLHPRIEPVAFASLLAGEFFITSTTWNQASILFKLLSTLHSIFHPFNLNTCQEFDACQDFPRLDSEMNKAHCVLKTLAFGHLSWDNTHGVLNSCCNSLTRTCSENCV